MDVILKTPQATWMRNFALSIPSLSQRIFFTRNILLEYC